jgi:RNA polymerase sigma-70 factor (ECF subfamily)
MPSTHLSLLAQAQTGSPSAWAKFVALYQPLLYGWLRRQNVSHDDAQELTQEVLAVVVQELASFDHQGRTGGFRRWLRQITVHRALGFLRARKIRAVAAGGSTIYQQLQQVQCPDSGISKQWDREFDQHVLRHLLRDMESQFEPTTIAAFRLVTLAGVAPGEAAQRLGITVGAVYSAKSRVMRKLRQEAEGLVDDALLR